MPVDCRAGVDLDAESESSGAGQRPAFHAGKRRRSAPRARARPIPWQPVMLGLWAIGALVVIGRLIAGTAQARQMAGAAFPMERPGLLPELLQRLRISRPVRVLEMTDGSMPMTWGLFRPTVLLPKNAYQWRADRLSMYSSHGPAGVVIVHYHGEPVAFGRPPHRPAR